MSALRYDGPQMGENLDTKVVDEQVEGLDFDKASGLPGQRKSEFDQLSVTKTLSVFWKAACVCFIAGGCGLADGFHTNILGSIVANPGFVAQFGTVINPNGSVALAAPIVSAWGGAYSATQILGTMFFSTISDRYGRKTSFAVIWIFTLIGMFLFQFCTEWKLFLVSRLLSGFPVGGIQSTLPAYICEFAPVNARGVLLLTYYIATSAGLLASPVVFEIISVTNPTNYKLPIILQWPLIVYMGLGFFFLPESPWYYAMHDQEEKAKAVLTKVYGKVKGYDVDNQYAIIKNTLQSESVGKESNYTSISDVFKSYGQLFKGSDKWRTFAACVPLCCCQLTGVVLFSYYSAYFFANVGFSSPYLISLASLGTTSFTQLVIASVTDYIGRRRLVLGGNIVCTICVTTMGLIGSLGKQVELSGFVIALVIIWSMNNCFLGTLGGSYTAEMGSSKLRTRTAGFGVSSATILSLIFTIAIPYMLNPLGANLGLKVGYIFGAVSFIMCFVIYFIVPETARRSPAELDELFENGTPAWRFRKTETRVQIDLRNRVEMHQVPSV